MSVYEVKRGDLRHSWLARRLRRYLYYLFVDKKSWPITFEPPKKEDNYFNLNSPNLYVHLPFCEKICHYCPYVKYPFNSEQHQLYGKSLINEIKDFTNNTQVISIESLYFGGGTPSLSSGLVEQVINLLRPYFTDSVEVAIELHPSHCSSQLFRQLKQIGITRVSIGIETFSPVVLKVLGRPYSSAEAKEAVITAIKTGFDCIDINLIYAIPQQGVEDVKSDVNIALSLGVDQISAYPLFAFRHTGLAKSTKNRPEGLRAIKERVSIQKVISRLCLEHKYKRTSVWSFTRPGVIPYTTVTRNNYRGFGVGAGSRLKGVFWFNTFSLDNYMQEEHIVPALVMRTGERFQRFHWLYWQIYRTSIDPTEYRLLYKRELEKDFRLLFLTMRLLGWLKPQGKQWQVTERGAIFVHLFQSLFSLSYIDILWTRCQSEAQPQKVVLE